MAKDEVDRVFNAWQNYAETADKLFQLGITPPESFLPYPLLILEEAINVVAKKYFDAGDKETSEVIQRHATLHLMPYYLTPLKKPMSDEEALEGMIKSLTQTFNDLALRSAILTNLKKSQSSWMSARRGSERIGYLPPLPSGGKSNP